MRRLCAWALLGLILALVIHQSGSSRARISPLKRPPFDPGTLGVLDRPVGSSTHMLERGQVILYVRDDCAFCLEELAAWRRARTEVEGPIVVLSPGSDPAFGRLLAARSGWDWAHDYTGDIGRRLGVRGVPFLAVRDRAGIVVEAFSGVSPPARILRLSDLTRTPSSRGANDPVR